MSSHQEEIKQLIKARTYSDAVTLAQHELNNAPTNTDLLYLLAVAARYDRQFSEAKQALIKLLELTPGFSRALQEFGHMYRDQQEYATAAHYYQLATESNPALISGWKALIQCYQALGEHRAAQQVATQIAHLEKLPKPLRIANDLLAEGKLARAEKLARQFLAAAPHHPDAMAVLAEVGQQMGALDESLTLYRAIVKLRPDDMGNQFKMIQLLRKQHYYDEALAVAKQLKKKHPEHPQCLSIYAIELMQLGHYEQAIELFDKVLALLPNDATALVSKAHALKTLGQQDEAVDAYRTALKINPNYGEAWYSLANLKTVRFNREDVDKMMTLAKRQPPLNVRDQVYTHFALGKALEDQKAYEQAFAHYERGNYLKKAQSRYSASQLQDEFVAQQRIFNSQWLSDHQTTGHNDSAPIFIVGLPRAGSTLLEQILSSHSQVDGTHELPNILAAVHSMRTEEKGYPECLTELSNDQLQQLGKKYIDDTKIHRKDAPYFIDKMPNNFRHIGLIKLILPNAKIIDARRNPMDCCFSGFKQLFAEGQEFSYNLKDLGEYYRDYTQLMDHWHNCFPDEIIQLNHEELIEDFDHQLERLLRYCGLEMESTCREFHKTERAVRTASSEQVRQPINSSGMNRWVPYQAQLTQLIDTLGDLTETYAEKSGKSYEPD